MSQKPARSANMNSLIMIGIVAVLGIGGFVVFKLMKKPKSGGKLNELDYDDEDDLEINEDDE